MIVHSWITMRTQWSTLVTTDPDGVKTWETGLLYLGFSGADITCMRSAPGTVYTFTTAAASDWYVSQRADWFNVSDPTSASLVLTVSAAGLLAIDGMTEAERLRLFRGLYVYCRRQSDGAIGVFDCHARGLSTLATGAALDA